MSCVLLHEYVLKLDHCAVRSMRERWVPAKQCGHKTKHTPCGWSGRAEHFTFILPSMPNIKRIKLCGNTPRTCDSGHVRIRVHFFFRVSTFEFASKWACLLHAMVNGIRWVPRKCWLCRQQLNDSRKKSNCIRMTSWSSIYPPPEAAAGKHEFVNH